MVDTVHADSSETATDLQSEWDRLAALDAGGQPEAAPNPDDEAPAAASQDDQGPASRPPAEPAAGQQPAGNETQVDIWANAPAELKAARDAEVARLEQAARSQGGRAQAEARRNAELAAELEALRKQQQPKVEEEAPVLTEDQRKALKEEYPDVAGPLLDLIEASERKMQSLIDAGASQQEQRQAAQVLETQRLYAAEEQRLSEAHPDWLDVVKQPGFAAWVDTQPRMVKEALARNANQITDADEATDIIGRYKSALPSGDGLQARREAQQRGSQVPKPRTTVPTPSTTTDQKSEWDRLDALDRQREAQRAGAKSTR